MKTTVRTTKHVDAAGALEGATRKYLLDGAQVGFNKAREEAPVGATGFLQGQAMQEPKVDSDGSVWWGNLAEYAEDVEEGTDPHLANFEAIKRWARRVIGIEGLAGAVWRKIAKEGTDPQPFIEPGVEASEQWFAARGLDVYYEDRL